MVGQGFMEDIDADVCGDFFDHIDDLLDFHNEDIVGGEDIGAALDGCWPPATDALSLSASSFSGNGGSGSTSSQSQSVEDDLAPEFSVPCEDIAELEWLSNFMDDSIPAVNLEMEKFCSSSNNNNKKEASTHRYNSSGSSSNELLQNFQTSSPISVLESSSSSSGKPMPLSPDTVVPGRARSKRPRPASFSPRTVPLVSPASSDTSSDVFPTSPAPPELKNFAESQPPPKKKKKLAAAAAEDGAAEGAAPPQAVRKCLHCEIQKTPQWRMGPMGPKTLCNACGVRYKSGRLYPEYRPAASPTFLAAVHSNSHKKVLEMRVKSGQKGPAPTPEFVRKSNAHLLDCA